MQHYDVYLTSSRLKSEPVTALDSLNCWSLKGNWIIKAWSWPQNVEDTLILSHTHYKYMYVWVGYGWWVVRKKKENNRSVCRREEVGFQFWLKRVDKCLTETGREFQITDPMYWEDQKWCSSGYMLVFSLLLKSKKEMVCDVFNTFDPHAGRQTWAAG